MKTRFSGRKARGFTLIELMVAMGITAVIVTILVTITGVATDTWTRSRSEIRAARQAKAMLDTMAKDFESFVSRRGNNFEWMYAAIDNEANLPSVSKTGGDLEAAELTFFTAATDRYLGEIGTSSDLGGDVSCVSYRMRYSDPIEGGTGGGRNSSFVLYRHLVNPDETFRDLLGREDLEQAFSSLKSRVTEEENFICENVYQFTVTFLVEVNTGSPTTGGGNMKTVRVALGSDTSSGEFRIRGNGIETDISPSESGITLDMVKGGRVKAVELSISVISDAGLARIDANGGLNEKDYARQTYHYSRVVELPGM